MYRTIMTNLPSLENLLRLLQQVPYLASKNLYRVANFFLEADDAKIEQFCRALKEVKQNISACETCFSWREKNQNCGYCANPRRDQTMICVVASWQDLLALERTQGYQGVYHVLGGLICPLEGVSPSDLKITQLIQRVAQGAEVVLAISQTPEGEVTSAYIADKLKDLPVKITCLARGVPVGSTIEYMDRVTLYKALSERRPF
ncbi:MAG TPA: recombination mediator RecR [Candidatus Babeliales bacterium]|nr:recombination mediator RecR [Candidatus Babeliales bacterium]